MLRPLQFSQAGSVGRRDIEHAAVGPAGHAQIALSECVSGALERYIAVLADVDENRNTPAETLQTLGGRVCAVIVESEAVDEGMTSGVAEDSRLGVPGLWMQRHRSHFEEAEAERGEERHHHGVLVEAGGDADRRSELHSPQHSGPGWNATNCGDRLQDDRNLLHTVDLRDGEIVRVLGVEEKKKTADQRIHRSTRSSGERTDRSTSLACCRRGMARTSSGP